jgi:hypothetical protein
MHNLFAFNIVLQYKGVGRLRNYLNGERAYILLLRGEISFGLARIHRSILTYLTGGRLL